MGSLAVSDPVNKIYTTIISHRWRWGVISKKQGITKGIIIKDYVILNCHAQSNVDNLEPSLKWWFTDKNNSKVLNLESLFTNFDGY